MRVSLSVLCSAILFSLVPVGGLFIPEELPTLLSFLYTNIPPIFKGTDSRLGVGFRVGPNADFQVQVELGPQTRTKPAGGEGEGENQKRQVDELQAPLPLTGRKRTKKPSESPGTPLEWLQTWKAAVGNRQEEKEEEEEEGHPQPVVDLDTVMHLRQLYKTKDDYMKEENETQ